MYLSGELNEYTELDEQYALDELEDEIEEIELEEDEALLGVVSDCTKLNVRFMPNPKSDIVCTIDVNTEVLIDEDESTDEYYKVVAASGAEGYCMKKYITVLP